MMRRHVTGGGVVSSVRVLRWERRPEERPQEILEAALRVFAERGYRTTRLEDVGEAAGVTKGTIYHYFANKEELLLRAIDHYHEQAFGQLNGMMRELTGPASERIRELVRRWFGAVSSERMAVRSLLLQGVAHEAPEAYRRWLATGPAASTRLLAALVEEGQAGGEFRRDADAAVAARVLLCGLLLQGIWQQQALDVPELAIEEERMVESATEFFLRGLRA
jgi:AcrR family transcriptional regulator